MKFTRKGFLGGAVAFAAAPGVSSDRVGDNPLMRLGMISDVHLATRETGKGLQNWLCYEPALRYFDERRADGVVVAGDLADFGTGAALRRVAAIWDKVFPKNRRSDGKPIMPLFIYGDHDMGGYMHKFNWARTDAVIVSFPVAHATARTPRTYDYLVSAVKDGKAIKETAVYSNGQFWADDKDTLPIDCAFAKSALPADWKKSVRFTVAARDSFGNCGKPICWQG